MARKKRQMTEEQRLAAAERLRKAREARGHDGSASVHEDIRDLPEDHALHWKKVKQWIKEIQHELTHSKTKRDSKSAEDRQWYRTYETYLGNLKRYLDSGIYLDNRYGRLREGVMTEVCLQMGFDKYGNPKRAVGVYYPDLGQVWTKEMNDDYERIKGQDKFLDKEELFDDGGEPGEDDEALLH